MTEEEILNQAKVDVSIFVDYVMEEYETTCFIFKCARCKKYVTYAIKDSDLCYTYPIEMELKFDD